jgi:hypothetical protein
LLLKSVSGKELIHVTHSESVGGRHVFNYIAGCPAQKAGGYPLVPKTYAVLYALEQLNQMIYQ